MKPVQKYEHHGVEVSVMKCLKGYHTEHCLCYNQCAKFKPNTDDNCRLAQELYEFDCAHSMTTPVWECPEYESSRNA